MRLSIAFLALVPCLPICAVGQDTAQSTTTAERVESVCERLEVLAGEHHAPGMGLAIVTPDGVFTRGFGLADLENEVPATADTLFEIGSTTKTFTSLLLARLVELGEMDFDDPVREYVDYFHLKDPEADEQVTLRDLLSHRTGLTRTDVMLSGGGLTVEDVLRNLRNCEPMAPFRTAFLYNNQMFQVAGTAAESAGGASFFELVDEHLFTPLGMDSSTADLVEAIDRDTMSMGYRWLKDEGEYDPIPTVGIALSAPAGSILSSPRDMARYLSFLLARGTLDDGESLISRARFDEDLWSPQISMGPDAGYGLGFMLGKWNERPLVHHGGNVDGYTSQMALLPEEGLGFSLVVNCAMSAMQQASIDAVFGILLGEEEEEEVSDEGRAIAPEELARYVGDYDFAGQVWTVSINDADRLALEIPGQGTVELAWPDETGRWPLVPAPEVKLSFQEESEAVVSMTLYQGEAEMVMTRRGDEVAPVSVDEVLAKLGEARSMEAVSAAAPMRLTARVEMPHQGLEGTWTLQYRDMGHWRIDMDFGKFGTITTVLNEEASWTYVGLVGFRDLSATERAEAYQGNPFATPLAFPDAYESMSVQGVEGEGDAAVAKLKIVPKIGMPSILHVEMKSGHVVREEAAVSLGEIGAVPMDIRFADYKTRHGFGLAHRTQVRNSFTGVTRVVIEKIEAGLTLPEDLFERD